MRKTVLIRAKDDFIDIFIGQKKAIFTFASINNMPHKNMYLCVHTHRYIFMIYQESYNL